MEVYEKKPQSSSVNIQRVQAADGRGVTDIGLTNKTSAMEGEKIRV